MWHGYFGIENINLSTAQKQELIDALEAFGPDSDPSPARLNHWRKRLDNDAVIYEALFDESKLTIAAFKNRLAAIFGIDPGDIGHSVNNQIYVTTNTPIVTFTYNAINYLRVALFGDTTATWAESRTEVLGYLALNISQWE